MTDATALLLVAAAVLVAGVARRLGRPAPLLLVPVGLLASVLPGVSEAAISPGLALAVVLPPLVYSAALESSYLSMRAHVRPIAFLSVGLVLFTAAAVALVVHALVPGMTVAVALVLGAMVSPTDAVAATTVGRTLGLPRRILTILAGESLLNDGTGLTLYQVAVAAAVGAGLSLAAATGLFVVVSVGGVVVGLVVAFVVRRLLALLDDGVLENTVSFLAPFVTFAVADAIHVSGILAVVVAGLSVGHHAPHVMSYNARLQADALWRITGFVLESVVFFLIGLQLRAVTEAALDDTQPRSLALWSLAVLATVVVSRFVWVFTTTYGVRLIPAVAERDRPPRPAGVLVVSWAGIRGVVSVVVAFALPLRTDAGGPFPQRNLLVFLTFVVVVGTLLLEGATLPWLIRRAGLADETDDDARAEADAQGLAAKAAADRLDQVLADEPGVPAEVLERLRTRSKGRTATARERAESDEDEPPTLLYRRLRREMLAAEREAFARLRDEGRLDDEVMRRVHRELDLEEAMLARD